MMDFKTMWANLWPRLAVVLSVTVVIVGQASSATWAADNANRFQAPSNQREISLTGLPPAAFSAPTCAFSANAPKTVSVRPSRVRVLCTDLGTQSRCFMENGSAAPKQVIGQSLPQVLTILGHFNQPALYLSPGGQTQAIAVEQGGQEVARYPSGKAPALGAASERVCREFLNATGNEEWLKLKRDALTLQRDSLRREGRPSNPHYNRILASLEPSGSQTVAQAPTMSDEAARLKQEAEAAKREAMAARAEAEKFRREAEQARLREESLKATMSQPKPKAPSVPPERAAMQAEEPQAPTTKPTQTEPRKPAATAAKSEPAPTVQRAFERELRDRYDIAVAEAASREHRAIERAMTADYSDENVDAAEAFAQTDPDVPPEDASRTWSEEEEAAEAVDASSEEDGTEASKAVSETKSIPAENAASTKKPASVHHVSHVNSDEPFSATSAKRARQSLTGH